MKEFNAQTGGRYTYVDDIINLQNLALAFTCIFDDCDNFVISGCQVSGASISPGYVYINGKIRYFPGASNIAKYPQYIYESNSVESVAYASGTDKVGRINYNCSIAEITPTIVDPVTGYAPEYITFNSTGAKTIRDAYFGKYALLTKSNNSMQEVQTNVLFDKDITAAGAVVTKDKVVVKSGNSTCQIYYKDGNLCVQTSVDGVSKYEFAVSETEGFKFLINDAEIFTITEKQIISKVPIASTSALLGNLELSSSAINNVSHHSDEAAININMNGDGEFYRNTYIGNGKGSSLIEVIGKSNNVNVRANLNTQNITLIGNTPKQSNDLVRFMEWQDSDKAEIARLGFMSPTDNIFKIESLISDVSILGLKSINLGPVVKENGVPLSEKYVLLDTYTDEISKKADSDNVYTKKYIDDMIANKAGGFTQFVSEAFTKRALREQIDAVSMTDVLDKVPELSKKLSDMVKTEEDKKQVCLNIGALYKGDEQKWFKDSGWIHIQEGLYVRQIGNIVSIQGKIRFVHTGSTLFTIPNSIDPPTYAISNSTHPCYANCYWRCEIEGGSRKCMVTACDHCGNTLPISITYMV